MISVKGGTQTWSNSVQRADFKSDGAQNLSATDKTKALGNEESIGDVLNKVADPNYIDPSKKPRAVGNSELGKDAFMTLLLTQMKNQDPTNPLKSHEMAAQLAQFTSLEKLNNINDGISALHKDAQPEHNFQALSFIGKTISTDNSKVSRMEKDAHHDVRFSLPADAQTLTLQVKDSEGKVVRTLENKNLKAGKNEMVWNGLTDEGAAAPVGDYTLGFEAVGSNGHKLHVETKAEGVISGVNFTPMGPQLLVGKQVINMADVKSISQPGVGEPSQSAPLQVPTPVPGQGTPGQNNIRLQQQKAQPAASNGVPAASGGGPTQAEAQKMMADMAAKMFAIGPQDSAGPKGPRKVEVKPEHKSNAAKAAKMGKGNINDAAMAQGLINKLNKDGAKAGMGS